MAAISHFSVVQAHEALAADTVCFDIRDVQTFAQGHIPGAIHLTNDNLHQCLDELEFDEPVMVCCYHGISSILAANYLAELGFEQVATIDGGFEAWQQAGLPVTGGHE